MNFKQQRNTSLRRGSKIVNHLRIRTALRRRIAIPSLVALLTVGIVLFFHFTDTKKMQGAVSGDYRTKASGNWNSTATWQSYNGFSWVNASSTPTSANGAINILSGHTVTVTADVTIDQATVDAGGAIVINASRYLYENNGTGTDLTVNGTITVNSSGYLTLNGSSTIVVNGTITLASGSNNTINSLASITINSGGRVINNGSTMTTTASKWIVNSGGTFQHNVNGGPLPLATWNAGSTCEITGVTSSLPSNLNQSFSNFKWNCAAQSANLVMAAPFTTIGGDFTVASTNASQLQFSSVASTLTISGDYIQTGGTFVLSITASGSPTLNVSGDYTQSGGTFSVVTGNAITGTVNVSGNWNRTGGNITVGGNASTNAQFIFNKAGSQTFTTSGATVTGNIDFTVNNGSTLVMGNNILSGRNFTLLAGGTLSLGSAAGISSNGATGNIQVSGTRSYNTGADYVYNGTSAQNTGNGLPATVRNLTLTNSNGLTLTNTLSVTSVLTLTSGKINTGSNELKTTSTSTTSIQGHSSTSYIVGALRRNVSGTGTYDFPIGTSSNYELATVTLAGTTGFSDILATFTNVSPLAGIPLANVLLANLSIDKVLTYGYWTLSPNSSLTGGTYSVNLYETGNAVATGPAYSYCVLQRTSVLSGWQSIGTHIVGTSSGSILSAGRSGLNVFNDFCIGYGQYLGFKNVSLISGTGGQVNAIYKFPDAAYNIDVWIQIMSLDGGATLDNIDTWVSGSGNGYDEAWQPFINAPGNTTSSILWKLMFKVGGTATDTIVPFLSITGLDVDGGSNIKEFVEATMPRSYALKSTGSTLTVTNNNGNYRATSTSFTSIANIDTAQHQAMYQINYQNMSSFLYRTGVVNTGFSSEIRQHSLYFKSFLAGNLGLPIKLTYFKAKPEQNRVNLSWSTSSEINNDYFTIERSANGDDFEELIRKEGAGNSSATLYYSAVDGEPLKGTSYYRLKQTDYDGHFSYSETVSVTYKTDADDESPLKIIAVSPNPFSEQFQLSFTMKSRATVNLQLINSSGQVVFTDAIQATEGLNRYEFADKTGLQKGVYFLNLFSENTKQAQRIVKN